MTKFFLSLAEMGFIPDSLVKISAKFISKKRLNDTSVKSGKSKIIDLLSSGTVAEKTNDANEQHYEVPPNFFKEVLGANLKYSCSLFDGVDDLNSAEIKMLDLYIKRAEIKDGQNILDLGCGWGSFSLYVAQRFPNVRLTSISNSIDQINHIKNEAKNRGLINIEAIKMDVNKLELNKKFDRIISIEMFEHLRNYKLILNTLNDLLKDDGRLFIHIFCNKELTYLYEIKNDFDWMTKYFFLGGIMPSKDIFQYFNKDLVVINQWTVNGKHYSKTCRGWLKNHYRNKNKVLEIFNSHYEKPIVWFNRWRIFFLSCEAFFSLNEGTEYFVSHYLLKKRI